MATSLPPEGFKSGVSKRIGGLESSTVTQRGTARQPRCVVNAGAGSVTEAVRLGRQSLGGELGAGQADRCRGWASGRFSRRALPRLVLGNNHDNRDNLFIAAVRSAMAFGASRAGKRGSRTPETVPDMNGTVVGEMMDAGVDLRLARVGSLL